MRRDRLGLRLFVTVGLLGVLAPVSAGAAQQPTGMLEGTFGGNAYGTLANSRVADDIKTKLGRSAYITSGCDGTKGLLRTNRVDSIRAGKVARADTVYTTAKTTKTETAGSVRHTARIGDLSLLGGKITADAVVAKAHTRADENSASSNVRGSELIGLQIGGDPSRIRAGKAVSLGRIGHVVFKDVTRTGNGRDRSGIAVNMITVVVERANRFGLPIGARIVVGHAASLFNRTQPVGVVDGDGFAASAKSSAGDVENKVGRAAAIYLPCRGTDGKVLSNNVKVVDGAGLVVSATGRTTTQGDVSGSSADARTTAMLEDVHVLGDLITADSAKAVARADFDGTQGTASAWGSEFVNLSVGGVPTATPPPNTEVNLPPVGRVILNEQTLSGGPDGARARVIMIHVFVDRDNAYGLPVGTEIIVSSAKAAARRFE
jgi:hypothetical protein